MHCSASVRPVSSVSLPAAHGVHAMFARSSLKKLSGHSAQERTELVNTAGSNPSSHEQFPRPALPSPEIESGGQNTHTSSVVAPTTVEYVSAGHFSQEVAAGEEWKVPGAQGTQGPPLGPREPGLHSQSVSAALPSSEAELSGHARHEGLSTAPRPGL
eukprot:1627540-Rhodomonas_salina.1